MSLGEALRQTADKMHPPKSEKRKKEELEALEAKNPWLINLRVALQQAALDGEYSYSFRYTDPVLDGLSPEDTYRNGYAFIATTSKFTDLSSWCQLNGLTLNVANIIDVRESLMSSNTYPYLGGVLDVHINWLFNWLKGLSK